MFMYGHMLREEDTLIHDGQQVKVKDVWPSKYLGGQWVELWTASPDTIERCVTVLHVPDMEPMLEVQRPPYTPSLQIGGSSALYRRYYAN